MSDKQIDPRHQELAAQLARAAVDGDELALLDAVSEVVHAGLRCAVAVIEVLARELGAQAGRSSTPSSKHVST